jgi:hypothetical protein
MRPPAAASGPRETPIQESGQIANALRREDKIERAA